ncbi:aspartate aminotransferase family protein [Pseudomonas citri]|uniref:aspartate aminotransferase family protein n=1 Tax=Pseudomonas citri TaxID=2978349 RepID=UPI0028CB69F8|nr:aspartate aminotransferase family protein [Pseudomonas citri]
MINIELLQRRNQLLGKAAPLFYDTPLHIVRGEDVWLFDADGKRYLDAYNNVPVVGHCNPKVVDALCKQAANLNIHTRYLHENVVNYAERLTATFDKSLDMAIFTCTGSEANELALRMARMATGAKGIICSNCTYHGNTAAVDELSTMFTGGITKSPNVRSVPFPDLYRPLNGLQGETLIDAYVAEVAKAIEALKADGVGFAGILICPIFANEGLPGAPSSYVQKVSRLVREAGGLVIFDEVQSGFARTGHMWGQDLVGVVPDIVTMGKPMGNGHPIGAVVSRADLANAFRERVMYFNTFGGNPVSCAAGLAVLDVIQEERLLEHVAQVGEYTLKGLIALQQRHELIGDVRGSGLFFGIELVKDRNSKEPARDLSKQVVNLMKDRGVLISRLGPNDNVLKVRPPLPFTTEHADLLINTLDDCLATL